MPRQRAGSVRYSLQSLSSALVQHGRIHYSSGVSDHSNSRPLRLLLAIVVLFGILSWEVGDGLPAEERSEVNGDYAASRVSAARLLVCCSLSDLQDSFPLHGQPQRALAWPRGQHLPNPDTQPPPFASVVLAAELARGPPERVHLASLPIE